jgi:hypothetical protein
VGLVAVPGTAAGQDEREGDGGPPGGAAIERATAAVERLHDRGIYPLVGGLVSGSGLAGGVRLQDHALAGSWVGAELEGRWSVRGYHAYTARVGRLAGSRDALRLERADANVTELVNDGTAFEPGMAAYVTVTHRRYPRVKYWGPGIGDVETDYRIAGPSFDAVMQWQSSSRVGLSVRAGVFKPSVDVPGLGAQPTWVTVGVAAARDTRDRVDTPTRGAFMAMVVRRFVPLDGAGGAGDAGFTRVTVDGRAFRALGSPRHVAAVRLLASRDLHAEDGAAAFYLLGWLGGSHALRGVGSYRYRGDALAHVSLEYRWRAVDWLDVVPFVDAGAVADPARGLGDAPLWATPGVGLRGRSEETVYGRLEWAHGDDGHRVFVSFGQSF